jgi:hypothetical protein
MLIVACAVEVCTAVYITLSVNSSCCCEDRGHEAHMKGKVTDEARRREDNRL